MTRLLPVACLAFVFASPSLASPQVWGLTVGSNKPEFMGDVAPDGAGGAFFIGQTSGSLGGPHVSGYDIYLAHVSAAGSLTWQLQLGSFGNNNGECVVADGSGGCYLGSDTWGNLGAPPVGLADTAVVRVDAAGNVVWKRQFGTTQMEMDTRVALDGAGGVITACDSGAYLGNDRDVWIHRLDGNGNLLWEQTIGSSQGERLGDLVADGAGGAYLCGETNGDWAATNAGGFDGWICHIDANGVVQWLVQDGTDGDDVFERMVLDGSNRLYVSGTTTGAFVGSNAGLEDVVVARYDASGVRDWIRQIGGPDSDRTYGIGRDSLDGVVVVGSTEGEFFGAQMGTGDFWMAQVREQGTVAWGQQSGTGQIDRAMGVCEAGPGRFIVVGDTEGSLFGQPSVGLRDLFVALYEACTFGVPQAYCPGEPNSTGAPVVLSNQGSTSLALNDLRFTVAGGPAGQMGVMILGTQQAQLPFGDGTLCLGGNVQRILPPVLLSSEGKGIHQVDFEDLTQPTSQITPSSTWFFQFWYRDPASSGADFNLSNGLSATFCP
ncbi:MAG TPA: SBBP repeat-containing protein [Planctomycetota bacterium]|nr:SBBP repeat-containing protein [Planctomycetota bacterium]